MVVRFRYAVLLSTILLTMVVGCHLQYLTIELDIIESEKSRPDSTVITSLSE